MPIPLTSKQVDFLAQRGVKANVGDIYDEVSGNLTPANVQASPEIATAVPTSAAPAPGGALGLVKRTMGTSALPTAAAGLTGRIIGGLLGGLTGPAAEIGVPVGQALGGAAAGYLTHRLQTKGLEKLAEQGPGKDLGAGELLRNTATDVQQHPYITSAASLLDSSLAGGTLLPFTGAKSLATTAGLKQASKIAAINAGVGAASNVAAGRSIDPKQVGIDLLGGLAYAGKGHNAPPEDVEANLTKTREAAGATPITPTPFPATTKSILEAPKEAIKFAADNSAGHPAAVFRAIYNLKSIPDFNLTAAHVEALKNSTPASLKTVTGQIAGSDVLAHGAAIRENKLTVPALEAGNKAADAEIAAANAAEDRANEMAANRAAQDKAGEAEQMAATAKAKADTESAAQAKNADLLTQAKAAQIPKVEDRTTSITDQGITQPRSSGAAEASAKVMQQSQNATVNDFVKKIKSDEAAIAKLGTQAEQYPVGTPERDMYDKMLLQERRRIDADHNDTLAKLSRVTTPEFEPTRLAGKEEALQPRPLEAIKPPTTTSSDETPPETTTSPSPPETPNTPATKPPIESAGTAPQPGESGKGPNPPAPAATSYEGIKAAMGLTVKPGQRPAAEKLTPEQAFSNSLGTTGPEGQRARGVLKSHAALIKQKFGSVDAMREAFDALPSGDRLLMAHQYDAGAESYVPKLQSSKITPAAEALLAKKAGKKLSIPGQPQAKPVVEGGQPAKSEPFPGGAGQAPKTEIQIEPPRGMGLTPEVVESTKKLLKKILPEEYTPGAFIGARLNKANPIELLANPTHLFGAAHKSAEVAHESVGPRFTKAFDQAEVGDVQMMNRIQARVAEITKGLSRREQEIIPEYLYAKQDGLNPAPLPPKLQAVADEAQRFASKEVVPPDAPYISENGVERPREDIPNFFPEIKSREVMNRVRKGGTEADRLREVQINHTAARGNGDYTEAEKEFVGRYATPAPSDRMSSEFSGIRRPAGKGLAPEWREKNLNQILLTYGQRVSRDYNWNKFIESDPQIAKGLNLPSNGKGESTPEVVLDDKGHPIKPGILSQNAGVQNMLREYTGVIDPEAREFEHIRNISTIAQVGPYGRVRHSLIAQNNLRAIMRPEEEPIFAKAAKNLYEDYSGSKQQALESGSLRYSRNLNPVQAVDMLDGLTNTLEKFSRYTGAEKTTEAGVTFLDQAARLLAKKRLAEGDTKFLDEFGPNDWRTKGTADDIINYISGNLTRTSWGVPTGKLVPQFLTRGQTAKAWAPFFALSRPAIAGFNNWKTQVYDQAVQGNITPLLHTLVGAAVNAAVLNKLRELITGKKPPELTWAEYLKLGGQDTANTLFSKAATAGYAGILSHIGLMAIEFYHHEPTQGFTSLTYVLEDNLLNRLSQWNNAWRNGEADLSSLATLGVSFLKDQVQLVRQLNSSPDRGFREERIARRLGYIPPQDTSNTVEPANPFSLNQSYLRGDADQAANVIRARIARGQKIERPTSEVRTEHMRGPEGDVRNYYRFIEAAQGPEAAKAARERDIANTRTKYATFSSALQRR